MKIYLARHGESEGKKLFLGRSNPPLSALGRVQSEELATRLSGLDIHRIVSSNLDRAVETAAIVGRALALAPSRDSRFDEIGYGEWDGLSWGEIEHRWPSLSQAKIQDWWGVTPPGGEPAEDFFARLTSAWEDLASDPQNTLLVAHVGVNGVLRSWAVGDEPLAFNQSCGDFIALEIE